MALSQKALQELQEELARLKEQRDGIDASMSSIKAVLVSQGASQHTNADQGAIRHISVTPSTRRKTRRHKHVPLRGVVSEVIQRTPGLTPGEIAKVLEQTGGVSTAGKSTLRERVSHEMYRLKRLGIVRKRPQGGYVLVEAQAEHEPEETRPSVRRSSPDVVGATKN